MTDESKKVLLVRGPNSDVECSFNTKSAEAIRLSDFQNDIVITSPPLFSSLDVEFYWIAQLQSAPPQTFVVLSKNGAVGEGTFPLPAWHKRQGEDLLHELDIKIEHGTEVERGVERGKFATVEDVEHVEMIARYANEESMGKIAEKMQRSSATVSLQVKKHDRNIARVGFCIKCQRAKGEYETIKVGR